MFDSRLSVRFGRDGASSERRSSPAGITMPSILIADDSAVIRRQLRNLLQRWPGVDIFEAVDGLDAIEKAKWQQPDIIILDLSMPRMNGLDAARVIKIEMARVPIILFTMYAHVVPPSVLVETGINALVSKGDASALVSRIENMLRACSKNTPD
jgi:CheY-like chemotaxis protein